MQQYKSVTFAMNLQLLSGLQQPRPLSCITTACTLATVEQIEGKEQFNVWSFRSNNRETNKF